MSMMDDTGHIFSSQKALSFTEKLELWASREFKPLQTVVHTLTTFVITTVVDEAVT